MSPKIVNDLGEDGVIQLIHGKGLASLPSRVRKGIGEDCAVLETDGDSLLLVTMDTLIEGIHFTAETLPPQALGWKALAVNVSDIAAVGGTPHTAFLSMGIKPETEVSFVESFMAGFEAMAAETDIVLAGGDTVESPSGTVITVTLLGGGLPEHLVYRSGAKIGDDIWVTGPLGNAAAGLFVLLNRNASELAGYESLISALQRPIPRLEIGKALGQSGLVHAMIDISDGVAKDLRHICEESGTGALLQAASLPLSGQLEKLASLTDKDPAEWALQGGEDYELLFTASSANKDEIVSLTTKVLGNPAAKIGTIVQEDGMWFEGHKGKQPLGPGGYTHFSK
ncbi:MAG: thiamine-phosphate kinase [Deltaproteobacteria bacterium]|nr:thiamine-phosphate kinase [Deltaproteobacteria bacterium]